MVRNLKEIKQSLRIIKYQLGLLVLRNIVESYYLDELNGNTLWSEAIKKRGQTTTRQLRFFPH